MNELHTVAPMARWMRRPLLIGLALITVVSPLAAQDIVANDADQAERRLRVCLSNGAPGAPRELAAAVVALRSLCYTQINRVRDLRLEKVDESLRLPRIGLTPNQQIERERARDEATRKLNDEIARAISTFTGLSPARPVPPPPPVEEPAVVLEGRIRDGRTP